MKEIISVERLREIIVYLESEPKAVYTPFPEYDSRIRELLNSLGFEDDYQDKYAKLADKEIEKMTLNEIKTTFSFILRGERFCDGCIGGYLDDGTLLKLAKREAILLSQKSKKTKSTIKA